MNNTVVRSLSGIIFLGIMIGAILFSQYAFLALITLIVVLGMLEFYRLTIPTVKKLQAFWGVLSGVLLCFTCYVFMQIPIMGIIPFFVCIITFFLSLAAVFITELYTKSEKPFETISYIVTGALYVALPFALMNVMVLFKQTASGDGYNGLPLLAYFTILWSNDVGAYCFGMLFGRHGKHKLFPRHSPKKSWEGFIGGLLMSILAGYLVSTYLLCQAPVNWMGIGLVVSVFATFGDLVESMLKRSAGVKDSGNIMPGHGGILDRFDGVLLSFIPALFITVVA